MWEGQESATERALDRESQGLSPSLPQPQPSCGTLSLSFSTSTGLGRDDLLVHEPCSAWVRQPSMLFIHSFNQPTCTGHLPGARLGATASKLRTLQGPNYKVMGAPRQLQDICRDPQT